MTPDQLVQFLVVQLPNFAGLIVCVAVEAWIIRWQHTQIAKLQARIDELCGDDTPGEVDKST